MKLTKLDLFAVLFFLGGVLSVFTVGVIQWASFSRESASAVGAQDSAPQGSVFATPSPVVIAIVPAATITVVGLEPTATVTVVPTVPTRAPATHTPLPPTATHTPTLAPPSATLTGVPPTATNTPRPTKTPVRVVYYRVRLGDNLTGIAARFGTTVGAIMRANNLSSSVIYAGQVLVIPVR